MLDSDPDKKHDITLAIMCFPAVRPQILSMSLLCFPDTHFCFLSTKGDDDVRLRRRKLATERRIIIINQRLKAVQKVGVNLLSHMLSVGLSIG